MSRKRNTQVFINKDGNPVHVLKAHVDKIMVMGTDGDFTKLETIVAHDHVIFKYVTNYSVGEITLLGVKL